jgi:hypothetical protein
MVMDKNVTNVVGGAVGGKIIQSLIRWQGDKLAATMLLYPPTKYATDLMAAGYKLQAADVAAAKTAAEIGTIIMQASGYTFASGPGNLRGTNKLTADPYTYQAAAGQKVPAYMMPSTWGSAILGIIGIADGYKPFLGKDLEPYKLVFAAAGGTLLADGIAHGLTVDNCITAPSGFDVSTQPTLTSLDQSVVQNLKTLANANASLNAQVNQLKAEIAKLTGAPGITVTELAPGSGLPLSTELEAIKARSGVMGGSKLAYFKQLSAMTRKANTGLATVDATAGVI